MVKLCYFAHILYIWIKGLNWSLKTNVRMCPDIQKYYLNRIKATKKVSLIIMHFLDSFFCWSVCLIHSTNVCGTPIVFRALFYIFLLEFMDSYHRICSLTVKGKKLHCYRGTLIPYHRRSNLLFLLENNYHAEAKIIFKALLCVCKHKAARHMSAVGSEHSKEKALKQQLLLLIPQKHTLNKARCSVVVSRISQWCLCQRTFFSYKMKKGNKVFRKDFRFLSSVCRSSDQEATTTGFEPSCHPPAWCKSRHTEGQLASFAVTVPQNKADQFFMICGKTWYDHGSISSSL